jgi:hypothetical protein
MLAAPAAGYGRPALPPRRDPKRMPGGSGHRGTPATAAAITKGADGKFSVTGSHTFADEGTYKLTITVTDPGTAFNTAIATSTAKIADHARCERDPGQRSGGDDHRCQPGGHRHRHRHRHDHHAPSLFAAP